jgi:hypothetical protein
MPLYTWDLLSEKVKRNEDTPWRRQQRRRTDAAEEELTLDDRLDMGFFLLSDACLDELEY